MPNEDVNPVSEDNYQKTEGAEPQPDAEVVDDMLAGFWPGAKQEQEPSPVEEPVVEPTADQPAEPDAGAQPEPQAPATKIYKYRGREYTAEQLLEQGILEDALTSAEQLPHYQQLYLEKLEAERQEKAIREQQQRPGQQQQAQQITPERLLASYGPVATETAKMGFIEPDFVDAYPNIAAGLMFHRDMIYDLRQVVSGLVGIINEQASGNFRQNFMSGLEATLNELSTEGGHYAALKDQPVRSGFYEYLRTLDVPAAAVNKQFLAKQWLAYNSDAMIEAITAAEQDRAAVASRKTAQAAGEAAASAKTKPVKPQADSQEAVINEMLDGFWPSS